jgi:hypothetical protein
MSERRVTEESRRATSSGAMVKERPFGIPVLRGWRRVLGTVAALLLVASVVQELLTPRKRRTWHGVVLGFVPYDLRPPTLRRVRETLWNPTSHRLFTSRVFGVGWTLNLHEVWVRLRAVARTAIPGDPAPSAA